MIYDLCVNVLSHVQLFVTPWTVLQAFLSMGFPRQEYWRGLPSPTAGDLPGAGTEPLSLASPVLAGGFFTAETSGKPGYMIGGDLKEEVLSLGAGTKGSVGSLGLTWNTTVFKMGLL